MTKKCLFSFITYVLFLAVCFLSMHLMLLVHVNKYVGVGIGFGLLAAGFIAYMFIRVARERRNKTTRRMLLFLPVNAIGCGLAISSLFVYLGGVPYVLDTVCAWVACALLFLLYCLLVKIPLFKHFPRICLAIYGLFVLGGEILMLSLALTDVTSAFGVISILMLVTFILFIAFLATILSLSADYGEHCGSLAVASFIGLAIVVLVVFIIISEGEALEGADFSGGGGGGSYRDRKKNPYDFYRYDL